jgi:hypothetical protein
LPGYKTIAMHIKKIKMLSYKMIEMILCK